MKNFISFNDTKIEFKKDLVEKTYILKAISYEEANLVSRLIYEYFKSLELTGIKLPKLIKYEGLNFTYEFCGESLIDTLKKKNITSKYMDDVIEQISEMLNKCSIKNVGMDPHIKNFTILNGEVFYVDTFPPVTSEYLNLLTNYNKDHKKNIKNHLGTWKAKRLMYHFLADIKKTKGLNKSFYQKCKKALIKKRYIRNFDVKKVNEIIEIEEGNLFREGFTLS